MTLSQIRRSIGPLLVLVAVPAFGATYPCPNDPGFCYFDVANDGCFDGGVDTGPIDADLEAGAYNVGAPAPGSIVCPPSVKRLNLVAEGQWETSPRGHILIYAAKVSQKTDERLTIDSGGDLLVQGRVSAKNVTELLAAGAIELGRGVGVGGTSGFISVHADNGDLTLADRANIKGYSVSLRTITSGDILLGERVKIRNKTNGGGSVNVGAAGNLEATDLQVVGTSAGLGAGGDLLLSGISRFSVPPVDDGGPLSLDAGGVVRVESMRANVSSFFSRADDVRIGLPNDSGVVGISKIKVSKFRARLTAFDGDEPQPARALCAAENVALERSFHQVEHPAVCAAPTRRLSLSRTGRLRAPGSGLDRRREPRGVGHRSLIPSGDGIPDGTWPRCSGRPAQDAVRESFDGLAVSSLLTPDLQGSTFPPEK